MKPEEQQINKKRIDISEIKATAGQLREPSIATVPKDLEQMYAGLLSNMLMKLEVGSAGILSSYERMYPSISPVTLKHLQDQRTVFLEKFATAKLQLSKIIEQHPLWAKVGFIKGLSSYQLGLIMSFIKDISKFNTYSALSIYCGQSPITDPVTGRTYSMTKSNIKYITEIRARQGKEFKGFNTAFAGRLFVLADCLMRAQGFFYNLVVQQRKALEQRAINLGKCVKVIKKVEGGETELYYMANKKNNDGEYTHSLKAWSLSNARHRMLNVLMNLIWEEWRKLEGLEIRQLYVQEKLGHTSIIKLDEIERAEAAIKAAKPKRVRKVKEL